MWKSKTLKIMLKLSLNNSVESNIKQKSNLFKILRENRWIKKNIYITM